MQSSQPSTSFQYIGNPDFRGYLAAQAMNGNTMAGDALGFVGNDGKLNQTQANTYHFDTPGASNWNDLTNFVNQQYGQYNNLINPQQSGSSSGSSAYGPQYAAYYQDTINQLQPQLGQLDNQQGIGLQNIANSYNLQQNRAQQQKAQDQQTYNTQTGQNEQSYLANRNNIMQNTMSQSNALQRLLGIAGSGNSSAAYEQAPYAAGLQGSQQLFGAQQTYGQNKQGLDTNWTNYLRQFQNSMDDLNNQKFQQEQGLKSSIAQTRANLLNSIAQANVYRNVAQGQGYQQALDARQPFQSQINDLLGQITNLGNQWQNPQIQTGPVTYQTPAMNDYSLKGGPAPSSSSSNQNTGDVLPAFFNVLQPQRNQYGQLQPAY